MILRITLGVVLILLLAVGPWSCGRDQEDRAVLTDQAEQVDIRTWGTYLGRDCSDEAFGLAVDRTGCVYITGFTCSDDFPVTAGAFDRTFNGGTLDAFVVKIDPQGQMLIYSTLLGGSGPDRAWGIAVGEDGRACVTGRTRSDDFPVTPGVFDPTANGDYDLFAARLDPEGAALEYATFIGGRSFDTGAGIALDGDGCAYLTGWTSSSNFPVTAGAFDRSLDARQNKADAVVIKLDPTGRFLRYATFLGGAENDWGQAIAVDEAGRAHVGLLTRSLDFPVTREAFQTVPGGITDAAAVKLDPSGGELIYATLLGGSAQDWAQGIAVDEAGRAHLTGVTSSEDFPVTPGAFSTRHHGFQDVFVAAFDPGGRTLISSTFLGGSAEEQGTGILARGGKIYLTGSTRSADFPTTPGAFDERHHGKADAFLALMSDSGDTLVYCSLLGGAADDVARAIGLDHLGGVVVTGWTESEDLPVTPGAIDEHAHGKEDIFVFRIDPQASARP